MTIEESRITRKRQEIDKIRVPGVWCNAVRRVTHHHRRGMSLLGLSYAMPLVELNSHHFHEFLVSIFPSLERLVGTYMATMLSDFNEILEAMFCYLRFTLHDLFVDKFADQITLVSVVLYFVELDGWFMVCI